MSATYSQIKASFGLVADPETERDRAIDAAIADGRISPDQRGAYQRAWDESPIVIEASIEALPRCFPEPGPDMNNIRASFGLPAKGA